MTWPTTWESLRSFPHRAPCGCRYATEEFEGESGHHVKFSASPNRMQRCFRHRRADGGDIIGELLLPIEGLWDA